MDQILAMFKLDLGITNTAKDPYFNNLIEACIKEIENKGIAVDYASPEDIMLISDYAAWKYRKRQEDAPLPENIRYRIRNKVAKARGVNYVVG